MTVRKELSGPTTLQGYCDQARKTDRFVSEVPAEHYTKLSFGFFGEVGGLLSALKKARRDQLQQTEAEAASDELGDALWYLVNMSYLCDVLPPILGQAGLAYLRSRFSEKERVENANITLRQFDGIASLHHSKLMRQREMLLRDFACDSGKATSVGLSRILAEPLEIRAKMYGRLLGQLALLSASFELRLENLAQQNLDKIFDRWPGGGKPKYHELTVGGKAFEQLPPRLAVKFVQRRVGTRIVVVQQIRALNVGDPLTDNSHRPDGYRFHDVFHLSYATHLGWSPVIRALLKVKRKSEPQLDENEDGARAIIIEEGIATWIFNHARRRRLYADVEVGRLDYGLLRQVRSMVDGFQVAECPLWQWERAILDGFRVFREVYDNRGGTVVANLKSHTLIYKPLQNTAQES
jgi:MazG C-terminal domain